MFTNVLKSEAAQRAASRLLGLYVDVALRTTRWTIEGAENLAPYLEARPVIAAFWHESLPLIPALWRHVQRQNPGRRATMLVSRHRDGRVIGRALQRFGLDAVHGSTARHNRDKGGAAGLRALLGVLAAHHVVAVTPDGPRGPRRIAAGGVAQLAALSGAAVLPIGAHTNFCIRLPTWDRMVLPLPWGRGRLVCLAPIHVSRDAYAQATPFIAAALTQAADQAARA